MNNLYPSPKPLSPRIFWLLLNSALSLLSVAIALAMYLCAAILGSDQLNGLVSDLLPSTNLVSTSGQEHRHNFAVTKLNLGEESPLVFSDTTPQAILVTSGKASIRFAGSPQLSELISHKPFDIPDNRFYSIKGEKDHTVFFLFTHS